MKKQIRITSILLMSILLTVSSLAQQEEKPPQNDAGELAKTLANPIGALISVPFQNNMDIGIGESNGSRNTMNIQPIVPFSLSSKFSLITRYIVPVIAQYNITSVNVKRFVPSLSGTHLMDEMLKSLMPQNGTSNHLKLYTSLISCSVT